jgi:hypothetical protein
MSGEGRKSPDWERIERAIKQAIIFCKYIS